MIISLVSACPQCQCQHSLNVNVNISLASMSISIFPQYQWQYQCQYQYQYSLNANVNINISLNVNTNINVSLPSGAYSVLQVVFILQRNTGYFLIQVKISWFSFSNVKLVFYVWWGKGKWNGNLFKVYVPCTLIVVLSWVSFGLFINIFQTKLSLIF